MFLLLALRYGLSGVPHHHGRSSFASASFMLRMPAWRRPCQPAV